MPCDQDDGHDHSNKKHEAAEQPVARRESKGDCGHARMGSTRGVSRARREAVPQA